MKRLFASLILVLNSMTAFCMDKLPEKYLVQYGNPKAEIQVTHYFSFNCPHCVTLFREDFESIRKAYIDTDEILWIYHPIPRDVLTIQAMHCLENLDPDQKQIFLEIILEELLVDNPKVSAILMEKVMELFKKPIPTLQNKDYLSDVPAFLAAFDFIKQNDTIKAVPSLEINGKLFLEEFPDQHFIEEQISKLSTRGELHEH